jgi:hypothetical protein
MRLRQLLSILLTFVGIAALYPLALFLFAYLSQTALYLSIFGLRDGIGTVSAFVDLNADGVRDPSEAPLQGVCILSGYRPNPPGPFTDPDPCHLEDYDVTDSEGRWDRFLPGGDCGMLYVFAVPPSGYHSTNTPASKACSAQFGFVQDSVPVSRRLQTVEEFARREKTREVLSNLATALAVLATASIGTWWLHKKPRQ